MAVQNNYNNYIKRQKQNSTGMFRDKIKNSLGGVAVGNNTTKKPVSMMGQAPRPVDPNRPKPVGNPVITTPPNNNIPKPQAGMSGYASKPIGQPNNINAPQIKPNALQSNLEPQNPIGQPVVPPTQPGMPQNGQPNLPQEGVPVPGEGNTGMMSLADINEKMKVDTEEPNLEQATPLTAQEMGQINEMAKDPAIQAQAYAKKKTPQEMAKELFEQNKKQAQKDWEMKQKELELQNKQLQENYEQSKKDADSSYKETTDVMNETRYQQQQDLALSGQSRGIQYSPQQLGLENVANINHNKNLAEASTKRNELLNQLSIQLGQALANVQLGHQNTVNEYNKAMQQLTSDYQNQMINWQWDDQKTAEERKWQEAQTKADREWEKKMQEASQKWQSGENALDRKEKKSTGRSGGYYSGGGGRRNYSAYRGSSYNYTPYSRNGYGNGGYQINEIDTNDPTEQVAMQRTMEEYSTDMFNGLKNYNFSDLDERAQFYKDEMGNVVDQLKGAGMNEKGQQRAKDIQNTAIEKLFKKAYSMSTGTPYTANGTIYPAPSVFKPYKPNAQQVAETMKRKGLYDEKYSTNPMTRLKSSGMKNIIPEMYEEKKYKERQKSYIKTYNTYDNDPREYYNKVGAKKFKEKVKKTLTKPKTKHIDKKKTTTSRGVTFNKKALNKSASNFKKNFSKTSSRIKAQQKRDPRAQARKRTQAKFKKSFNNFKKNIKKFFKR